MQIKSKKPASGKPTGKVVLKDGKKKLGKFKVRKGKASIKTTFSNAGPHTLKAQYKGDRNWKKSNGKTKVTVRN